MTRASINTSLKGWAGWAALLFVIVGLLAVGGTRDRGPLDPSDRVDEISRHVACPVCDGESVFESRNPASEAIRAQIRSAVAEGAATDDEILAAVADAYGARVLLVPRSSGFDSLIWVLPATAAVMGIAALSVTFRRWRREAASGLRATPDDYAAVDRARREREANSDG